MKPNGHCIFLLMYSCIFGKNPLTDGRNIIQRSKRYSDAATQVIHTQTNMPPPNKKKKKKSKQMPDFVILGYCHLTLTLTFYICRNLHLNHIKCSLLINFENKCVKIKHCYR